MVILLARQETEWTGIPTQAYSTDLYMKPLQDRCVQVYSTLKSSGSGWIKHIYVSYFSKQWVLINYVGYIGHSLLTLSMTTHLTKATSAEWFILAYCLRRCI